MSDKPHAPEAAADALHDGRFALPGYRVAELSGPDAAAFAQAQFTSDVASLAPGDWHWSGWLTPKGRLQALFALLRLDAGTLWMVLPDADPAAIGDALRRFVFRSKLAIVVRDDLHASACPGPPASAAGSRFSRTSGGIELDLGGDGGARSLHLSAESAPAMQEAAEAWRAADLAHGLPRLDASQGAQWTPQQLSLDRLRAYSVRKGCYPGQEIVARTHFLGQAKRGLVRLAPQADVAPGGPVESDGQAIGTVVSAAPGIALAVLPLERDASAALAVDGAPASVQPLLGGLAR